MGGVDTITGNAGTDTIVAGDGDDIIIVASAGDANSDIIDGGGGSDTLQLSVGSHTFNNDASIQNIQKITLNASGTTVNLDGQTEGLTISGGNGNDNITSGSGSDIIDAGSGSDIIYAKVGSDTISLGNNDNATDTVIMDITDGLDLIKQFKAGSTNGDIFKYTGNLNDVESSQNLSNGSNNTDEILSGDFISQSKNASLDIVNLVIGFQTGITQNGLSSGSAIDFTGTGIFFTNLRLY